MILSLTVYDEIFSIKMLPFVKDTAEMLHKIPS